MPYGYISQPTTPTLYVACSNLINFLHRNETVQPKAETKPGSSSCSPVELALKIKKFDIAKQMVIAGANPIDPNPDEHQSIPTLLEEYYYFGTNKFISWLLNQHLLSHNLPKFIEDVMKIDMYNASGIQMFNSVGRDPTHALLTCGNEYFIREFLESKVRKIIIISVLIGRVSCFCFCC